MKKALFMFFLVTFAAIAEPNNISRNDRSEQNLEKYKKWINQLLIHGVPVNTDDKPIYDTDEQDEKEDPGNPTYDSDEEEEQKVMAKPLYDSDQQEEKVMAKPLNDSDDNEVEKLMGEDEHNSVEVDISINVIVEPKDSDSARTTRRTTPRRRMKKPQRRPG